MSESKLRTQSADFAVSIIYLVAKAKTETRILYASQKNSQKMKNTTRVQFSDNILSSDYANNLLQFKQIVKDKFRGTTFENSGLPKFSARTEDSLSNCLSIFGGNR